jgi:hypothetical protein
LAVMFLVDGAYLRSSGAKSKIKTLPRYSKRITNSKKIGRHGILAK